MESTARQPAAKTVSLAVLADALNAEERAFCEALATNPGILIRKAGIKAGWSARSVSVTASRALARPDVQAYIAGLKQVIETAVLGSGEKRVKRKIMKAQEVLARLTRIGRASMRPHLQVVDGEVVGTKIDPEHADTLRELTFTRRTRGQGDTAYTEDEVRAKVADPMPALEALRKYHGLEKVPKDGGNTINVLAVLGDMDTDVLRAIRDSLAARELGDGGNGQ